MMLSKLRKKAATPLQNLSYRNKFTCGQLVKPCLPYYDWVGEVLPSSQYSPERRVMLYDLVHSGVEAKGWPEGILRPITFMEFIWRNDTSKKGRMIGLNSAWRFFVITFMCAIMIFGAYAGGEFGLRWLWVSCFSAIPPLYILASWFNYKRIWK